MAHIHKMSVQIQVNPPIQAETQMNLSFSPEELAKNGFNLPVSISASSLLKQSNQAADAKTVTVMAHFDTGASRTSIDTRLAEYMGLTPVGMTPICTAAGTVEMPNYAVDISFPSSNLSPFINLPISSCKLPFCIEPSGEIELNITNFGILIGRDIMSRWNIVWNGPSSTVFVSD